MDTIIADGDPVDLAVFTHALLDISRILAEKRNHEREVSEKFSKMSFEDLMKMERDEEE